MNDPRLVTEQSVESLLADVTDEFVAALRRGDRPDIEDYAQRHPQIASVLRMLLPALQEVQDLSFAGEAGTSPPDLPAGAIARNLGDFHIIREVGRGGMGVVYEAEQISLGRHVALKVLPFAAVLDERQLTRFKNEARAAAMLHHTNIVPVFSVGSERGVHFYAMQFIEGQTLARLIADMRGPAAPTASEPQAELPDSSLSATQAHDAAPPGHEFHAPAGVDTACIDAAATIVSERSTNVPAYFRTVARLGIQAAEALEHAHQHGVIHRDVKPSNVMLDAQGNLWITDFGLARLETDAGMTMTGDLVGTLRYMSPEQALGGKRIVVDHRTDVYSLGVTLYELLTLSPPFAGADRADVLRQIAFDEPQPPHRRNRAIPRELETIVCKAMARHPAERYATAQELADDLWRYLEDKPITAKRPGPAKRAVKWIRRHKLFSGALSAIMLSLVVALGFAVVAHQRDIDRLAELNRRLAAEHNVSLTTQQLSEAQRSVILTSEQLSNTKIVLAALYIERASQKSTDLKKYDDAIRDCDAAIAAAPDYAPAYATRGCAYFAVRRFRMAADDFRRAIELGHDKAETYRDLGASLNQLKNFSDAIAQLTKAIERDDRVERVHLFRAEIYYKLKQYEKGLADINKAIELDPKEPHSYGLRGVLLERKGLLDEAIVSFTEAIRLRPNDWKAHNNLGLLLHTVGRLDAAIESLRQTIRLQPDAADSHRNLGRALKDKGLLDEAIASFREAIRLKPDFDYAHSDLGHALQGKGMLDEAVSCYRKAIECDPSGRNWVAYYNLGHILLEMGRLDEAIAIYRQAVRVHPSEGGLHHFLGISLRKAGAVDEAIVCAKEAVRLGPDNEDAHAALGHALLEKGNLDSAIESLEKSIQLSVDYAVRHGVYDQLAEALRRKGGPDAIVAHYEEALREQPDSAVAHLGLAAALGELGDLERARQLLRRVRRETLETPEMLNVYCALLLVLGDTQQYETVRREVAAKLSAIDDESHLRLAILLCCFAPADELLAKQLVELVEKEGITSRTTKGLVQYRAGNWQQAKEIFLAAQRQVPNAINYYLGLALSCHRLNELDEARQWFDRGERELREQDVAYEFRLRDYTLMLSHLLHREAAELLGVKSEAAAQASPPESE